MKTKLLSMTMALFLGCANAAGNGITQGRYFKTGDMTAEEFVALFKDPKNPATPEQMCSEGGNLRKKTLRSYSGKYCNNKEVCNLLKDNCFPGGKDPHGAKTSGCYTTCKESFGPQFFELARRDAVYKKAATPAPSTDSQPHKGAEPNVAKVTNEKAQASPEALKDLEKIKAMPIATLPELESKLAAIKQTLTNLGRPTNPTTDPNVKVRVDLGSEQRTTQAQIETLKNQEKSKLNTAHAASINTQKPLTMAEQLQQASAKLKPLDQNKIKAENAAKDALKPAAAQPVGKSRMDQLNAQLAARQKAMDSKGKNMKMKKGGGSDSSDSESGDESD